MSRTVEELVSDLAALAAGDFDDVNPAADGMERLYGICDELGELEGGWESAPALFAVMERLDDVDLGSPGPLVHTLEKWIDVYQPYLAESIRRQPSRLGVWMANRVLNSDPPDAEMWLALLHGVSEHHGASAAVKEEAREFLDYQTHR